jgi:hypothetical protein
MIACCRHGQADQDGRRVADGAVAWFKTAMVMHGELSSVVVFWFYFRKTLHSRNKNKNTVNKKKEKSKNNHQNLSY